MKMFVPKFTLAALATALVIGLAVPAPAQSTNKPVKKEAATKSAATKSKNERLPLKGTIGSVDTTAMTIKVGARTFLVTSTTKFMKAGKPATFAEAKAGEECGGSYKKIAGDKLELTLLRLGPKADGAAAPAKPAESKKKPAQP